MFTTKKKIAKYEPLTDSKGHLRGHVAIDQFNAQECNIGFNGFPANDITLLSRASSENEYNLIISRLQEIQLDNPDNSNKTDKQIILDIMPSWIQSPSEIDKFMDYYNRIHPDTPMVRDDISVVEKSESNDNVSNKES